ncbi:unnamed protein product, partial [Heterosigma akashiwo]
TGFLEIHLDDQTDSKSLFGSYICTDVPGEFTWQPGVLTQAVTSGKWVLIEDLDRCPAEVLASLLPLLEGNRLPSPRSPGGYLAAAPGPPAVGAATAAGAGAGAAGVAGALWRAVGVAPLRPAEAREVARRRHPGLPSAVGGLLTMFRCGGRQGFFLRSAGSSSGSEAASWSLQLCQSADQQGTDNSETGEVVSSIGQSASQETILNETDGDGAGKNSSSKDQQQEEEAKTEEVSSSSHLNFSRDDDDREDRARSGSGATRLSSPLPSPTRPAAMVADSHWASSGTKLRVLEEAALHRQPQTEAGRKWGSGFAMTTLHNQTFLSSVAAASSRRAITADGKKLVRGKTTLVQEIASGLGVKLVVQNMSLQTDSTDLLGGYRPVEVARWGCCQ